MQKVRHDIGTVPSSNEDQVMEEKEGKNTYIESPTKPEKKTAEKKKQKEK